MTLVVLLVGFAVWVGTIIGAGWLQKAETVEAPDGTVYRVQVGPTGVPWISAATNYDASVSLAPIHLIRYSLKNPKTWTIEVRPARFWRQKPVLLSEQFPHREPAIGRWEELLKNISDGAEDLGKQSSDGPRNPTK
jgi:hypothetical protein